MVSSKRVARSLAHSAITAQDAIPTYKTDPLSVTAAKLDENAHEVRALARGFYRAYTHVLLSVQRGLAESSA